MVVTLPQLFTGFLLSREAAGVRDTTLGMYRTAYRSLLSTLEPEVLDHPDQITSAHLVGWAAGMRNYAAATRDQRIAKLKAFFAWCTAEGYLAANPALVLKRPRKDWQPDPLTTDEIARLLEYARRGRNGIRNYALVCLLLDTGVRNSELCAARRSDLNLRTGQLTVTGKGGKTRTVVMGKRTRDALWRWLATRESDELPLFATENNRPLTRTVLRRLVADIGTEAAIPHVYPHRLRHTFAILYLRNHGDPYTLQYMLGHEDMTVTRQYVKLAAQDITETYRSPLDSLATQ